MIFVKNCYRLVEQKHQIMKKLISTLILSVVSIAGFAQSQNWWRTNGNTPGSTDIFGTTNAQPINFTTNNTLKMVLDASGNLRLVNFAGTGTRVVTTDVNGNLLALPQGTVGQFLGSNGTWQNLPVAATTFGNTGNDIYLPATSKLGIGVITPTEPLDVLGNAKISGTLKLSALSGTSTSAPLFVDNTGNVFKGMPAAGCVIGSPQWSWGGDNFLPFSIIGGSVNDAEVGTCNNYDFILKANNSKRVWFQTDGTVSFGSKIISNTGGPEYKFDQGALRLTGGNTFGGPMLVFGGPTSPYGDWGIEYTGGTGAPNAGLNFWKPFASTNANNNILFMADNNRIGMGTDVPSTRLTIDAWNEDGLLIKTDPNKNVIDVYNKNTNQTEFRVKANGVTQIGEGQFLSANKLLTVNGDVLFANNGAGINQYNGYSGFEIVGNDRVPSRRGISVEDDPAGDLSFFINSNQSNGGPQFRFKNGNSTATTAGAINDLLTIDYNGKTKILATGNNALGLSVINNNVTTAPKDVFNVYNNGYTEIDIYTPNTMPQPYGSLVPRVFTIRDMSANSGSGRDLFTVNKDGKVYAREVEINLVQNFPDYVFAKDYKLKPLNEVESYINKNKHLPNFEKGEYYEKNGVNVTDLLLKQQQTIEELMLYNIQLQKQNEEVEKRLKALEEKK